MEEKHYSAMPIPGTVYDRISSSGEGRNLQGTFTSKSHMTMKKALSWEIKPEEVELISEIGKGAYGVVYKGKWRETLVAGNTVNKNTKAK